MKKIQNPIKFNYKGSYTSSYFHYSFSLLVFPLLWKILVKSKGVPSWVISIYMEGGDLIDNRKANKIVGIE
jgi:hypothetical protein